MEKKWGISASKGTSMVRTMALDKVCEAIAGTHCSHCVIISIVLWSLREWECKLRPIFAYTIRLGALPAVTQGKAREEFRADQRAGRFEPKRRICWVSMRMKRRAQRSLCKAAILNKCSGRSTGLGLARPRSLAESWPSCTVWGSRRLAESASYRAEAYIELLEDVECL